jgi:prepilin-type N-terminal cleavage/methylation domain-containing protein
MLTPTSRRTRHGFTLVEILVVIVIIGILAGIAIPAIGLALKTAKVKLVRVTAGNLDQAIESYKSKYNAYPPDFSSWNLTRKHYQQIFPEIEDSELNLLLALCDSIPDSGQTTLGVYVPAVMDRAEALVWALGGFSSDPQYPFTGTGGPLALIPGATDPTLPASYQYNSDRANGLFEFSSGDLSLVSPAAATISISNRFESNDEEDLPSGMPDYWADNDLFPVFRPAKDSSPYVYFEARTYDVATTNCMRAYATTATEFTGLLQLNGFMTSDGDTISVVRPIKSDTINANVTPPTSGGYPSSADMPTGTSRLAMNQYEFMNKNSFQILAPGIDGHFGIIGDNNLGDPTDAIPSYWMYPSGQVFLPLEGVTSPTALINADVKRYDSTVLAAGATRDNYERDNIGNFTNGTFEGDLP